MHLYSFLFNEFIYACVRAHVHGWLRVFYEEKLQIYILVTVIAVVNF